jgi:flagellar biosynthetic protein FliR
MLTLPFIASFLAAFVRCAAFIWTAPLTGSPQVPAKVKVMAAAAFAIVVASARGPMWPSEMALAIPWELCAGAIVGFSARAVLAAAEVGGHFIGLPFALGFAASFDPEIGESAMVTRRIAYAVAAFAFLSAGGLEAGVRAMAAAPATDVAALAGATAAVDMIGDIFAAALRFAAPAILAGLIANIGVALASRAAPSLNVFSVMLAAMLVVGGLVLIATAPAFARDIEALANYSIDVMGASAR